MVVVALLVLMGVVQIIKVKAEVNKKFAAEHPVPMEEEKIQPIETATERGLVLGIQVENEDAGVLLASKNFSIKEIKFGGDVSLLANSYENIPLQVTDIRSEVIATKDKKEMKLLVYWKTNKLALSRIEFSKMNMGSPKKIEERDFGFSHSVILPHLEPSTAYTYVIVAQDNWGNTITSDKYSAYTGAKEGSVIDLIMNTMKSTFGWAIKK